MEKITPKELRVAEATMVMVETRIRTRLDACIYCEQGSNAYQEAKGAIDTAFKDVRGTFRRMKTALEKKAGESIKRDQPCHVHISEIFATGIDDQVFITISGADGQLPYVGVVMDYEAFGKVIAGNGLQPGTITRWNGS